ncbi:MAG: peptidase M22 [Verrucomicrobia bacterium]|nr:peptidase M22 [Verrucomicrobiota bacterium]
MPSLRQLLDRHPNLLVVDSSSTRVEAAVWKCGSLTPAQVVHCDGESSAALPKVTAQALAAVALTVRALDAVAFCAGPGSVLGIRLAAASLRAWRAINPSLALFSYQSLPLLAAAHPAHAIVADARRDSWHLVRPGAPGQIQRLATAELIPLARISPLGTPATFRRWSSLPPDLTLLPLTYSAAALVCTAPDTLFFTPTPEPEAFLADTPSYVTWTPQIHQAPGNRLAS